MKIQEKRARRGGQIIRVLPVCLKAMGATRTIKKSAFRKMGRFFANIPFERRRRVFLGDQESRANGAGLHGEKTSFAGTEHFSTDRDLMPSVRRRKPWVRRGSDHSSLSWRSNSGNGRRPCGRSGNQEKTGKTELSSYLLVHGKGLKTFL